MTRFDAQFPKKRISVGSLIHNGRGELLIVKPSYRDGWLLPGGIVEAGESPALALRREVAEEIGLELGDEARLLCVDYLAPTADYGESLHLLFAGPRLDAAACALLRLDGTELSELRFCTYELACTLLVPSIARRLLALQAGAAAPLYLEDGRAPHPGG